VAGIAQARQSTTVTIRECEFANCNGTPILYGGEAWRLYDNTFEPTVGSRGRAFTSSPSYPSNGMIWIGNWFGDITMPGDQWVVMIGDGFIFEGNVVGGAYSGSGTGSEGVNLHACRGFKIEANTYTYCSVFASLEAVLDPPDYGSIQYNVGNGVGTTATGSGWGANVDIRYNKP